MNEWIYPRQLAGVMRCVRLSIPPGTIQEHIKWYSALRGAPQLQAMYRAVPEICDHVEDDPGALVFDA